MGHTNNVITAPINVQDDLGTVLGTGSGDVGTNCTSNNINKWAKYKPTVTGITPEPIGYINDEIRVSVNWGLTINAIFRNLATFVSDYGSNYSYTKPSSWFRVFDFVQVVNGVPSTSIGYYHNAKSFVTGNTTTTNSTNATGNKYYIHYDESGITVSVNWYRTNRNDEIGIADLNLGVTSAINGYFGVILVDNTATTNKYRLICDSSKIQSSSTSSLTIPETVFTPQDADLSNHSFSIYPVISLGNENATGDGLVTNALNWDIIALPDITPYTFTAVNASNLYSIEDPLTSFTATYDARNYTTATLSFRYKMFMEVSATQSIPVRIRIWAGNADTTTDTPAYNNTVDLAFATDWQTYNNNSISLGQLGAETLRVIVDSTNPAYYNLTRTATCNVTAETPVE